MKTILVTVDFSEITEKTVQSALALAEGRPVNFVFLHIVYPVASVDGLTFTLPEYGQLLDLKETRARRAMTVLVNRARQHSTEVTSVVVRGLPAQEIIRVAREQNADLIVMGSHGHGAMYELVVGSTTHAVLKNTPCPILIVPADPVVKPEKRTRNFLFVGSSVD